MTIALTINAENGKDLIEQLKLIVGAGLTTVRFDNRGSSYVPPAGEAARLEAAMREATLEAANLAANPPIVVDASGNRVRNKRGRKAAIKEASNQADLAANPPAVQETAPAPVAAIARAEKAVVSVTPKADEPITAELCKALALEVSSKKGVQPSRDIILSFGVARLSELKPEQYADFVVKMKEKLVE